MFNGETSTCLVPKCNVLSCAQTTAAGETLPCPIGTLVGAAGAGDLVTVRLGGGAISSSWLSSHPLVSATSTATRIPATRRVTS